jgi:outer membrane biosynthesis protein TonB
MPFLRRPFANGLLKWGGISFVLHIALLVLLSLNPWPAFIKTVPIAYTVTLMPVSLPEPEISKPHSIPEPKEEPPKPVEKPPPVKKKEVEKPKKDDIVEKVKKPPKKPELPEKKVDLKHLQEALEEIHRKAALDEIQKKIEEIRKKAALDEIQKRVSRREKSEERSNVSPASAPMVSSRKTPQELEAKLNEYYSLIWAKIKAAWTIPENLLKETVDLETIIVLIIERGGKIQKGWFEKKSGNALYDQSAMRAIIKAEPLPPIPKEFSENTFEIGIRFTPD